MKKLFLIFILSLSIFSYANFAFAAVPVVDEKATEFSMQCKNESGVLISTELCKINDRKCILENINCLNDQSYEADKKFKHWIPLQVGIPIPKCTSLKNVICYQGNIVAVKNVADFVVGIFQFGTIVIAIFAVLWLMIGGVQYVTSAGDTGRAHGALEKVKNAFMSLIVIMLSFTILYQIDPKLTNIELNPEIVKNEVAVLECFDSARIKCGVPYENSLVANIVSQVSCTGTKCDNAKQYCKKLDQPIIPADETKKPTYGGCENKLADKIECKSHKECLSGFCYNKACASPPAGDSCSTINDCKGLKCNDDVCSFGRTAANCDNDDGCDVGYKCTSTLVFDGRCVPQTSSIFQACNKDDQCGLGLECEGKVCVPDGLNGFCTTNAQCEGIIKHRIKPGENIEKIHCIIGYNIDACTTGQVGSPCYSKDDCIAENKCIHNICSAGEVGDACTFIESCKTGLRCDKGFCKTR